MDRIVDLMQANKGYARTHELREAGFHSREITEALKLNVIEKIKPGLYKLIDYEWDENSSYIDVCKAKNDSVICLLSALHYHGLSTTKPEYITIAVKRSTDKVRIDYPPVSVYYFADSQYNLGIEQVNTKMGSFRIYNMEKSICDSFRFRNKIGEDLALEALKTYLSLENSKPTLLLEYAKTCRVKTILLPYLKAMLG
ncbi:MAG: hypothetical protein P9L91_08085 [Candidatus Zophobacter franzmannii]|nr:hypothetical protein [Candidatus Zophobacter franzmannii]